MRPSRQMTIVTCLATSCSLLLCICAIPVASLASIDSLEHLLLQRYLTIECHRERMTVQLDFNRRRHTEMTETLSEMIWRGRICIGEEKIGECCSQMIRKQGDQRHVISVGYSKCGIEKTFFETGFDFIVNIHFRDSSNRHEEFQAKCAIPFMESHVKAKMIASKQELKLSALNFVTLNDKSTDILPVRLGSNLHIAIEPTVEGMQERLHTYPLKCWTSSSVESHDSNELNRRYFIKDGCPVSKDDLELAVVEQNTGFGRFAEWTKVTLPISEHLFSSFLFNGSTSEESQHHSVILQCDVFVCTGHQLLGFQNAPTCPRASFCTSQSRRLPSWARARSLSVSLATPIRILAANATEPTDDDHAALSDHILVQTNADPSRRSFAKDCARECSIAAISGEKKDEECRISEGIPVYVVVIIALISFGFGVAFVATLWMIHIKTDPLRKIRCAEQHNTRSGTALSVGNAIVHREAPIVRPSSNSNANVFMTTALVERQRLVSRA